MKVLKIALVMGIITVGTLTATAGPHHGRHHHRGNDGVRLAANIIGLVTEAIRPAATVVCPETVVVTPPPVVHCPPPPRHHRPLPPPPRHPRFHHRGHRR